MAEVALAWALHQDGITSVLAGARNRRQVEQNARAADLTLDDAVLLELNAASEPVKHALGPHPDMWQNPEASRMR
jgi:aryl-alcohol dehydrogenase-like predicted oxidoreductase